MNEEANEQAKYREFQSRYNKMSHKKKTEFIHKMMKGIHHEIVRDFVVCDMSTSKHNPSSRAVIYHIPSGCWREFAMSYEMALHTLQQHPEADAEAINEIFRV